ncbi:MAG: DUF4390 domain-containing protein [Comamonadaceae bacterium]|nr:MAG: DUF4390 domain-containing protein [Comamonadaceae bacterium]
MKSAGPEMQVRRLLALCLLVLLTQWGTFAAAAELSQQRIERSDDGVYLSALVQFELPPVVEDALLKGIPMFFVLEADIYRDRWYWTNQRVSSVARTVRLSFQPLTRRWRVNVVSGLIAGSGGLRAALNQNYDSLQEALAGVQRISRWRIADSNDIDGDSRHQLEFNFRLDLSQLPRPFQIGVAGQRDWNISVREDIPLQFEPAVSAAGGNAVSPREGAR